MRKLATIRKIDAIRPIEGADAIECAVIGGWTVVVKKGEFNVGDMAVYLEIDSFVPTTLAPFLTKPGHLPKTYSVTNEDGTVTTVEGERLRTVKLRGQLSQGLLLKPGVVDNAAFKIGDIEFPCVEDLDVTERLGIVKWEKAIPTQLAGQVRGYFPSLIPKTDQDRCQNLIKEINAAIAAGLTFEVTEKLEGSSCTMFLDLEDEFHVCSRNLDLKRDENNSFWRAAIAADVENKLRDAKLQGVAIQGELIGPNIQGNIYKLNDVCFFVFDVYSVFNGGYLDPADRRDLVNTLGLTHAPVLNTDKALQPVDQLLAWADGESEVGCKPMREGIVFKQVNGGMSLKAISNRYLMAEK